MKEIAYDEYIKEATQALSKGAFLTVKSGDKLNTMTIGWGSIGYIWGKPIFMVMVRDSRYTYELIENSDEFTVSIPFKGKFKEELKFCGTKSGRDYDKFSECKLSIQSGQEVDTPIIKGCDLHYECKIKFRQIMDPDNLNKQYDQKWYPQKDYHTLYFGEIVGAYLEE
ncbi:flavin reductase family protein [Orenia marismortui]|uniref:Flavin reductase (DIM6/NTAB) family NADH-FMN oxidoreductase RutF n=1 Tax=Orenia marismortui TaxID=46469 RepID=A0A4R8HR74_9FIRM|nr:flavin reductase family protein [Orenia marismortui]TDX59323.1 flavin reductase (DIM6/NTAB) family NADH-FMN oxidoreductase RutF [Orenia marismortui]